MTLAVKNARIVTPDGVLENSSLLAEDGQIRAVGNLSVPPGAEILDGTNLTVLPGFLDLHIHGGGGADTMDATPNALQTILRTHARSGTTGLLLTTMTQRREKITAALRAARDAVSAGAAFCPDGAAALGIHLEGPYISPKRPGAQPREFVRDYDAAEFADWLEITAGTMRRITLASEQPGAGELIAACRAKGIVISLGHTDATSDQTRNALDRGATSLTHLFNAMPSLHHRAPGPACAMLMDDHAFVEIIADGHHVAPEMIHLALRAKGIGGAIFITDAMAGAGAGDGLYDLGGSAVTVAHGKAVLADGTLAGSILTMAQAAQNARAWFDLDWPDIAALTSGNAARHMNWPHKARLTPGGDADFVLVDDALNVHATIIAGRIVYHA